MLHNFLYVLQTKALVCRNHGHTIRNLKRHLADLHPEARNINVQTLKEHENFEIGASEKIALLGILCAMSMVSYRSDHIVARYASSSPRLGFK